MKQGWEIKKLKEVCRFVGGYTPSPSLLCTEGCIPYFKVSDMNRDGNSRELYNTELYLKETKKTYPAGAIVFPKNGGAVLTNKKRILVTNSVVDLNTGVAIPNSVVNVDYLYFFFCGVDFCNFVKEGTLPVLKIKEIGELPIFLPPLAEQERIVEVLNREFESIDAMKANAVQNLQHAKDLFQAALRKELQPKEGWGTSELRGVCTFYNGKPHENNIDKEGKYILVNSKFIASDMQTYKRTSAQLFPLYRNDIVMVMSDVPNGKALGKCQIICEDGVYSLNQRICAFRNAKIDVKLLYYLINRNPYLIAFDNGENQTNLRKNDIITMPIYYPTDPQEVAPLIERLDSLRESCTILEENYRKTIALCDDMKQTLLRKAFNGEL